MNIFKKRFYPPAILALVILLTPLFVKGAYPGAGRDGPSIQQTRYLYVIHIVDGDTIVVSGGETIRLIGVDTPEFGEPFFKEAKEKTARLVYGKRVRLVECRDEKLDKYGRTLAWVYVDGKFVEGELLKEGLARALIIPPCGLEKAVELKAIEDRARRAGKGIWGPGVDKGDFKKLFKRPF